MGKKTAMLTYCLAIGFILVVAFHSPSKTLIAASAQVEVPIAPSK
jgi:hypothetical protein